MSACALVVTLIANLTLRRVNSTHDDDPHPQYRFGLLPEPLTAPLGGWKLNLPMAVRPEAFPLDLTSQTDPAFEQAIVIG